MSEIFDIKQNTIAIRDRGIQILKNSGQEKIADRIKRDTDEVFSKADPSIMFYGIYNSGKSSIINAVFGEEIAQTGDVPTTYQVQRISWNGFTIVDTPGIDAKNEHTLVAESEIDKHDIILFVVDDMNIEEKAFYRSLIKVMKTGKPVIIVINEKDADGEPIETSSKFFRLKQRMYENIRFEAKNQGINDITSQKNFHGIIAVNALTAFTSTKLIGKDKELLYSSSGIRLLIAEMQKILLSSKGTIMLLPALRIMKKGFSESEKLLRDAISNDNSRHYLSMVERISRQRDDLYTRIVTEARNIIMAFGDEMSAVIISGSPSQADQEQLKEKLNSLLSRSFKDADISLREQYELCKIDTSGMEFNISKDDFRISLPEGKEEYGDLAEKDYISIIEEITKIIITHSSDPISNPTIPLPLPDPKDPGLFILIQFVKDIIELFKSKKKAEEEKKQLIAEVEEWNRQNENRINEMITRIMDINSKIRSELFKLEDSFTRAVDQLIKKSYAPVLNKLEEEYNNNTKATDANEKFIDELELLLNDINHIITMIES